METPEPPKSVTSRLSAWGKSSMAPAALATLIAPLHLRPARPVPLLFVPVLFFSSYANLQGFKIDSAGITMAASGIYALLAMRRKPPTGFRGKFSVRGLVRGSAIGVAAANVAACGWVYLTGNRKEEKVFREANPRWTG
ncbi:hypothetical protein GGR57DRAFT_484802 [Xylariaceae sp. FL1272]|nr:hypothetical protein GGR57DRAFT_484802 [Xylariaceae sp. FL1272]